jgi:hypothetical protein
MISMVVLARLATYVLIRCVGLAALGHAECHAHGYLDHQWQARQEFEKARDFGGCWRAVEGPIACLYSPVVRRFREMAVSGTE